MSSYQTDFFGWTQEQTALLKAGRVDRLDVENLVQELERKGAQKRRDLVDRLEKLLARLLKAQLQPGRCGQLAIDRMNRQRVDIRGILKKNPGLQRNLADIVQDAYSKALHSTATQAEIEESIFPKKCSWSGDDILRDDFLPRSRECMGFDGNLAPDACHLWAKQYYNCKQDFQSPDGFSPVPYFLLCRAIELELKSRHLRENDQEDVKKEFGHSLVEPYHALPGLRPYLDDSDMTALKKANSIYEEKEFEYYDSKHVLEGFSSFPDLAILDRIAKKLIDGLPAPADRDA